MIAAADADLSGRIMQRRRFRHRRIWQLLRRERFHVNHQRVYRLYPLSGLGVKRRRRRKGLVTERPPQRHPASRHRMNVLRVTTDAFAMNA